MSLASNKSQILVITRDGKDMDRVKPVLQREGYALQQYNSDQLEHVLLHGDLSYDCIILDSSALNDDSIDFIKQFSLASAPMVAPVILVIPRDHPIASTTISRTGLFDRITDMTMHDNLLKKVERAISYHGESRVLSNLQKDLKAETGHQFIIGPSDSMRRVIIGTINSVVAGKNLILIGEPGTGKRTLVRAMNIFFPKHWKLELDCDDITDRISPNEGHVLSREYMRNNVFEDEGTGEENMILLLNLHRLLTVLDPVRRKITHWIRNLCKSAQEQTIFCLTLTPEAFDWMCTDRVMGKVFEILQPEIHKLPPLNNRKEDIPYLANHFMNKAAIRYNKTPVKIDKDAELALINDNWPGNLYELEMIMKRAVLITKKVVISSEDLLLQKKAAGPEMKSFRDAKMEFERQYVINILLHAKGNISEAARIARKERKDLYHLLKKHHIVPRELMAKIL